MLSLSRRLVGTAVGSMLLALAAVSPPTSSAVLPVDTLFRKAQYAEPVLSPSGRYLAVIAPIGERLGLAIVDLSTLTTSGPMTAGQGDVLHAIWQTDERLIAFLGDRQEVAGEPPRQTGIVAINRDGSHPRVVAGSTSAVSGVRTVHRAFERPWSVRVLKPIPGTTEVLVVARERAINSLDLYRYDTLSGARTILSFESPGNATRWVVDFDGEPRAVVTDDVDKDTSAWYVRKTAKDAWIKVEETRIHGLTSVPLQFDPAGKILYVAARRGNDRASIFEYDVEGGRWSKQAISHPERDIDDTTGAFIVDYQNRKLLGFKYTDDRPAAVWFDTDRARTQKAIDAALPDTVNSIIADNNLERWIVLARSDRNPGDVFLLDAKSMRLQKLFSLKPWIEPASMATTKWIRYTARDGLAIPALLTMPPGVTDKPEKPLPLLVHIHGGPYVPATHWEYDDEIQFFASRGYAVLQPQFRGTSGFGWKHRIAGYRKWGDEMQDDLEDGVRWATAQGIADPSRVCFYGASYGGYAALFGAIKNAKLIKCAVGYVAATSIDYLFDNAQTDIARVAQTSTLMALQIGDPRTERERFKRVSPLDNADKVGVPLLLAYGGSDLRVPLVHGTAFRDALDRHHKTYEWVQYAEEGHGFNRDDNRFDYYHRVETFLAKYLQQPPEPGSSPSGKQ